MTAFEELSAEDQKDFRSRLARIDLDENNIVGGLLEVPAGQVATLNMRNEVAHQPLILETTDLDRVRKWVGLPDPIAPERMRDKASRFLRPDVEAVITARRSVSARGSRPIGARSLEAVAGRSLDQLSERVRAFIDAPEPERGARKLESGELNALRAAAWSYVRGERESVETLKPVIEAYFGRFQIAAWVYVKVHVKANSTLSFGPGTHNLTACEVIVEQGGRISSSGNLVVNATKLRRPPSLRVVNIPDHILAGRLRPMIR